MLLVVGLGNPGSTYDNTRHNVGFAAVDLLARRAATETWRRAYRALCCRAHLGGQPVLLMKPQTFMNLSGESVGAAVRFFKSSVHDVIVIHDELDFAPGVVRLKPHGGHGGHNGLRSLIQHLGSGDFPRIRLGIGKPRRAGEGANFVLSAPKGAERDAVLSGIERSADAAQSIAEEGLEAAMRQYNAQN